jgi:hypothetical protein
MAKIAVIHEDLESMGGAQSVFFHTIAALQDLHDVVTVTATPWDIDEAEQHLGIELNSVSQRRPTIPLVEWDRLYDYLSKCTSGRLGIFDTL